MGVTTGATVALFRRTAQSTHRSRTGGKTSQQQALFFFPGCNCLRAVSCVSNSFLQAHLSVGHYVYRMASSNHATGSEVVGELSGHGERLDGGHGVAPQMQ